MTAYGIILGKYESPCLSLPPKRQSELYSGINADFRGPNINKLLGYD